MNYIPISSVARFINKCKYSCFEKELVNVLQTYHYGIWTDLNRCYLEEIEIYQPNIELIKEKFPHLKIDQNLSATENFEKLIQNDAIKKYFEKSEEVDLTTIQVKTEGDIQKEVLEEINDHIQEFVQEEEYDDVKLHEIAAETNLDLGIIEQVAIKERGTVLENNTIHFLKTTGKYNNYEEQKRVRKQFDNYVISGKIDLIGLNDKDIRCVYEIKNRKSEFLHLNPPEYDYIQLYCYIYLVGKKGKLVSQCDGDILVHETISKKDAKREFENNIKPLLDKYFKKANKLIKNKKSKKTLEFLGKHISFC